MIHWLNKIGGLLCFLVILLVVIQNPEVAAPVHFLNQSLPALPLGLDIGVLAIPVALGVFLWMWEILRQDRKESRRTERNLEKVEISAEAAAGKIQALEAKIQTLETALEKALSRISKR